MSVKSKRSMANEHIRVAAERKVLLQEQKRLDKMDKMYRETMYRKSQQGSHAARGVVE